MNITATGALKIKMDPLDAAMCNKIASGLEEIVDTVCSDVILTDTVSGDQITAPEVECAIQVLRKLANAHSIYWEVFSPMFDEE